MWYQFCLTVRTYDNGYVIAFLVLFVLAIFLLLYAKYFRVGAGIALAAITLLVSVVTALSTEVSEKEYREIACMPNFVSDGLHKDDYIRKYFGSYISWKNLGEIRELSETAKRKSTEMTGAMKKVKQYAQCK